MLSSLKGFLTRHKKKFIVTGVIAGGSYVIFCYFNKKLQEYKESQLNEFLEKTKRLKHFESTERTCNQAIIGLSSNLCDKIVMLINTHDILEKLRTNPENKVELWTILKVMSFTQLTTLVYATSMLVISLRVQINVLGGYLFKDIISEETKISDEIQQSYMSLIQHFLNVGLKDLIGLIKTKCREVLSDRELNEKISIPDIEQIFWSIQMAINSDERDPNKKIASYVLPPLDENENDSEFLKKLINETLDMLESDDITNLCSNTISRGFSIVVDNIAEYYSETVMTNGTVEQDGNKPSASKTDLNEIININKIFLHLAKVIPIVNGISSKSFDSSSKPPNLATSLITSFLVSDKVKTLGANVYEVFST